MRKIIFGAALPVLLAMSGAAAAAPAPAWTVSEASGDVRLVENGKTRAARRGALLSSGSIIATGANARAVIVRGKEFVVVSPRSQIRVPAPAEARGGIIQMIADYGTALFRIEKKSTPHFGVRTPYLAAVVKGTTFTVNVGEAGGSVQVTEGAVEVSTLDGGAAELVRPGTVAMVGASDLYRLSLEGGETRSIRSDAAPAQGTVTSSVVPAAKPALHFGPAPQASLIAHAVAEHGQSLSQLTDGLLDGPSRADVVLAELSNQGKRVGRGDADDSAGKPATPPGPPGKSGEKPDTGNGSGGDAGKPDTGKPDGAKPPANDGKDTPPAGDGKGAPPADDGKDKPPADDGKGAPPPANDGKSTPPADGGKDKPPADDGKSPPPADGGKDKPPADVVKDKPADPPATDLPPPPPPADSGKDKPPADDGKDKPADPPAPDLPPLLPPVDGGKEKPAGPPATDLPPPLPPIDGGKGEPASPPATDLPPPPSLPEIDPVDVPSLPPPGPDDDSSGSGDDDDDADDDADDDDADGGLSVCVLGICVGGGGDDD